MPTNNDPIPQVTWSEVEAMFLAMADTPTKVAMVHYLVQGTRKQARFLTPTGTLVEICHIASALLDPTFGKGLMFPDSNISGASSPSSESPPLP